MAGTAACTRGRSAPATPRDVADRTGANGPERAAIDNMATTDRTAEEGGGNLECGAESRSGGSRFRVGATLGRTLHLSGPNVLIKWARR